MPRIQIPLPYNASIECLVDNLESAIGARVNPHNNVEGAGWRFVRNDGAVNGVSFVHWDLVEMGGGISGTAHYLLEIDDPQLATYFTLKYR